MNATVGCCSQPAATLSSTPSLKLFTLAPKRNSVLQFSYSSFCFPTAKKGNLRNSFVWRPQNILYCSNSTAISPSETEEEVGEEVADDEGDDAVLKCPPIAGNVPPVKRRRRRYRKLYPGEKEGITEEMRFIAMELRNRGKPRESKTVVRNSDSDKEPGNGSQDSDCNDNDCLASEEEEEKGNGNGETWQPSIEGFLKYLVDSKLVFSAVERIVDESSDVSYAYFRKTGLERSECLSKDLELLSHEGYVIPEPSNPGVTYVKYLEELGEKSPNLFLCHFYNIYFSHIAGGQLIAKKVSDKLLEGRELEFHRWEGEEEELLRGVREKLNTLGEHWSRDEKNKCLREATKAFRFLGQIVRLIIL